MKKLTESPNKLLNAYLEGINDKYIFKAVFLAGGPGSGKSFISNKLFSGTGAKMINSDEFFEFLLDKFNVTKKIDPEDAENFEKQMKLRSRAKELTNIKAFHYLNGMLPIIIDGTGRDANKIIKQQRILENIGYDTSLVFVNTSLEVALDRNTKRDRSVPEDIVTTAWKDVQNNLGKFQSAFPTMLIVDNSKSLDKQGLAELELKLAKAGNKLLGSAVKNPVGKKVINQLLKTGGKYLMDLSNVGRDDIKFSI